MINNKFRIVTTAFLLLLLLKPVSLVFALDIIIIANDSVKETVLKKSELRNIFLGDKSVWSDGKKINFAILRKGDTHNLFLETLINKTPKNFVRYWKRQILTGKAVMPILVETETEIVTYVKNTEGAIGYVSGSTDIGDLKVIIIQ